jgi:hypothetical protein
MLNRYSEPDRLRGLAPKKNRQRAALLENTPAKAAQTTQLFPSNPGIVQLGESPRWDIDLSSTKPRHRSSLLNFPKETLIYSRFVALRYA